MVSFVVVVAGFVLAWVVPAAATRASVPGPTAANPDSVVTSEDTPVTFDPLDNDSATLIPGTVTVTQPLHGTAVADPATGKITYTPAPHYNGPDSFSYRACDAANACPSASVSVDVRLLGRYRMVVGSLNADGTSTFATMWPDASGQQDLTTATGTAVADWAVLSPDGRKLATATGGTITVSLLDGSGPDQTATVCCRIERPEWSPDSSQLTFEAGRCSPGSASRCGAVSRTPGTVRRAGTAPPSAPGRAGPGPPGRRSAPTGSPRPGSGRGPGIRQRR